MQFYNLGIHDEWTFGEKSHPDSLAMSRNASNSFMILDDCLHVTAL